MAPAKNQGQRKVIPAHVGYLRAVPRHDVQNSSMLPHAHFQHTPLFACGYIYPRTVRNSPLRCESTAETTGWVPAWPGPEKRVFKTIPVDRPEPHICPAGEIRGLENAADGRAPRLAVAATRAQNAPRDDPMVR